MGNTDSWLKDGIEALVKLAHLGQTPAQVKIGDRTYIQQGGGISLLKPPMPDALGFESLTGLVDFLNHNIDKLKADNLIVHVRSPWQVDVTDALDNLAARKSYARAQYDVKRIFEFGEHMDPEEFVIGIQTLFVEPTASDGGPGRAEVLTIVGTMDAGVVMTSADDGITQNTARRVGVTMKNRETIQNPVWLRPYRTFGEIEQPRSPFILRVSAGGDGQMPQPALFECDNGAWRAVAMKAIKVFLDEQIDETIAVLA